MRAPRTTIEGGYSVKYKLTAFLSALTLGLLFSTITNATVIGAGGGDLQQSWGKDNTQTYGQLITVPTENVLDSFSFWLGRTSTNFPDPSEPSLSFRAYVYAWDGGMSHAVGPALYTSGVMTHNATPATPFTEYMINTGGLSLATGDMYALFFSTSGLAGTGRIQWEAATADEYPGGSFIFQNNGEDTSQWTTSSWAESSGVDLRFEAVFSGAVPEPSTWMMLITGLLVLGIASLQARRNGAAALPTRR